MKKFTRTLTCILALSTITTVAIADEDAELVINGELSVATKAAAPADSALDELISGWRFRTNETQAYSLSVFTANSCTIVYCIRWGLSTCTHRLLSNPTKVDVPIQNLATKFGPHNSPHLRLNAALSGITDLRQREHHPSQHVSNMWSQVLDLLRCRNNTSGAFFRHI